MSYVQATLMGLIQGVTEFLPVSSSGHLVLTSSLYEYLTESSFFTGANEEVFFDMILHIGTLVAVLVYFWKDIVKIVKDLFIAIKTKDFSNPEAKLPIFIIIGTFFTVLVAYPLKDISEMLIQSPAVVGGFLILTGAILYFSENKAKLLEGKNKEMDLKTAILIGLAQGVAAFPGISRSGSTIATGLFMGIDRITCARYSFLLSVPIIVCASIFYPILEIDLKQLGSYHWDFIVLGFFISLFSGYFCIKYFLKFLAKHSMKVFAYYCFAVGIFMLIFFGFIIK